MAKMEKNDSNMHQRGLDECSTLMLAHYYVERYIPYEPTIVFTGVQTR
jgi:hypothetical protein